MDDRQRRLMLYNIRMGNKPDGTKAAPAPYVPPVAPQPDRRSLFTKFVQPLYEWERPAAEAVAMKFGLGNRLLDEQNRANQVDLTNLGIFNQGIKPTSPFRLNPAKVVGDIQSTSQPSQIATDVQRMADKSRFLGSVAQIASAPFLGSARLATGTGRLVGSEALPVAPALFRYGRNIAEGVGQGILSEFSENKDPTLKGAATKGAFGGAIGAVAEPVLHLAGKAFGSLSRPVRRALGGPRAEALAEDAADTADLSSIRDLATNNNVASVKKTLTKVLKNTDEETINGLSEVVAKETDPNVIETIVNEAQNTPKLTPEVTAKKNVPDLDPVTDKKISNLAAAAEETPQPAGTKRLFQNTGADGSAGSTDWWFDNVDDLAKYQNNVTGKTDNFRFVDVPETAVTPDPVRPNVFRASVPETPSPAQAAQAQQEIAQAIEQAPPGAAVSQGIPAAAPEAGVPSNAADIEQAKITTPGQSTVDAVLPTQGGQKVGALDKTFRSTRSIIERQGPSGKQLADLLQAARDKEELFSADILNRIGRVLKLKGEAFENFVDAVEGKAVPMNGEIAEAVEQWQAVAPQIRDRAVAAGIDVGNLGETYFPHYVDYDRLFKDTNTFNKAVNHLVETGQAPTPEAAIQALNFARDISRNRRFGNLEASRLIDLPEYDKSPDAIRRYIQGATRRISQVETFGPGDETALKLLTQIAKEGGDTEAARNAFNVAVGAKKYNQDVGNVAQKVRGALSTTRLGLGAITNVGQNINTGIVTGHLRTLGSMVSQLSPESRDFVQKTGVISDAILSDLKEQTGFVGKTLSKITAPGFNKVESFNRSVAALAGKRYADDLAREGNEAALRKLGVKGTIGQELTEEQQIQAARKVVEKTQFKVDPQDLPGWVDSPAGRLVSQFRTFSYSQGKFFNNEILKPLAKGNIIPLARLAAAMPVGYGLYETKRILNRRPEEENQLRKGIEIFGNTGGIGLVMDIFRGMVPLNGKFVTPERRVSMAVGTFGGPAAGTAAELVGGISNAAQGNPIQLGRFGLRQLPVVGTALQNTFLPYKPKTSAATNAASDDRGDILNAAFGTKVDFNGKQVPYAQLTDDEKQDYARQGREGRALYTQWKAAQTGTQKNDLLPEGISEDSAATLNRLNRLTDKGKKAWVEKPGNLYAQKKAEYEKDLLAEDLSPEQQVAREADLIKFQIAAQKNLKGSDINEYFVTPMGQYELKSAQTKYRLDNDPKYSQVDYFKDQEELYKLNVYKDFSQEAVELYGMTDKNIRAYLSKNPITDKLWNELKALDAAVIGAGLDKNGKLGAEGGNSSGRSRGSRGSRSSGRSGGSSGSSGSGATSAYLSNLLAPNENFRFTAPKPISRVPRKIQFKVSVPSIPSKPRVRIKL